MRRATPGQDGTKWRTLLRRVVRVTGNTQNAEDYLHSAFLRLEAYRMQNVVRNPDGLLVRIAANLAIDEDRRTRLRAETGKSIYETLQIASSQPLQDEVLEAKKRLERVREGLAQLSPRTQEIFLMHRIEGKKYREIAAQLNISVSAVEKHIAKAALFLAQWAEEW